MLLMRSAYLVVWGSFTTYGHFVCTDGTKSRTFNTKTQAMEEIERLFNRGRIDGTEAIVLNTAILNSKLALARSQWNARMAQLDDIMDHIRAEAIVEFESEDDEIDFDFISHNN